MEVLISSLEKEEMEKVGKILNVKLILHVEHAELNETSAYSFSMAG